MGEIINYTLFSVDDYSLRNYSFRTCLVGGTCDKYRRPLSTVELLNNSQGGLVLSVRRSGRMCSGSVGSRSRCSLTCILDPQGAIFPSSNSPWRSYVYPMAPAAPFFRGMPTGPDSFLELRGVSGLRHCTWTHIKMALCHIRSLGGTCDKFWLHLSCLTYWKNIPNCCITLLICIFVLLL